MGMWTMMRSFSFSGKILIAGIPERHLICQSFPEKIPDMTMSRLSNQLRAALFSRFTWLIVLGMVSSPSVRAEERDDPRNLWQSKFEVLPAQRIVLNGDSIVKGYGFGNYTNPSPLRSLDGIGNILLKDNLPYPPKTTAYKHVWQGF